MSLFGQAAKPASPPDVEVQNLQPESISSLSFSPTADFLAVASWNNEIRVFEIGQGGANQGKASYSHEGPALSVCWSGDGTKVLSGGADKAGRLLDVATGQSSQFAAHDEPIRVVKWIDAQGGMAVTGSWDKTVRYWDLRSPQPALTVTVPERVYSMDVAQQLLVVATADSIQSDGKLGRQISIYNISNPGTPFKIMPSPLKHQTRTVACFGDGASFGIGSIEGRVAIQYVADDKKNDNFSFKCHRKETKDTFGKPKPPDVWAVNQISVHPFGTFSTAGADGSINIWDHTSRTRCKTFADLKSPVSATAFSRDGRYLAYALSYDWSQGYAYNTEQTMNKVMIHACEEDEVKKRPPKK